MFHDVNTSTILHTVNVESGCSDDQEKKKLTITATWNVDLGIVSQRFKNVETLRFVATTIRVGGDLSPWIKRKKLVRIESTRWDVIYILFHRFCRHCHVLVSDKPFPALTLRWVPMPGGACKTQAIADAPSHDDVCDSPTASSTS